MNRQAAADRMPARPKPSRTSKPWIPLLVLAAILAVVLFPVRQQLTHRGSPDLQALSFERLPQAPRIPAAATWPAEASSSTHTLILYDVSGKWGYLGGLYAAQMANLVSHFGTWTARPATSYHHGDVDRYSALIYIGSTYGEKLPDELLDDVVHTTRPVLWINDNILELSEHEHAFATRYGWRPTRLDHSPVAEVRYKGRALTRWARQTDGIMRVSVVDPSRAHVLALAVRDNGSSFPWATRAGNLTYVGENPFEYTSESDRYLAFADLLFDLLAPQTNERHRALVRLEDINPLSDPRDLRAVGKYLHSQHIPFGFGVSPYYRDPQGHEGEPHELRLRDAPQVVAALKYLERMGGVLVEHGYTHQWDGGSNPYDGLTGDDVEFYRVTESKDGTIHDLGPLPGDKSVEWAEHRIVAANDELAAAGFARPKIFEFPHYIASDRAYRAAAEWFPERWERSMYFPGLLGGGPIRYRQLAGQFFPYVVRDVYGSKVLPENLGSIAPAQWHTYKSRLPDDLVRAARANLVVRDGFASFYFHPYLKLEYLKRTVEGIRAAGYTFVDPRSL
jgi:uncharacterized protein YdaL